MKVKCKKRRMERDGESRRRRVMRRRGRRKER